jgi:hypothetical protein
MEVKGGIFASVLKLRCRERGTFVTRCFSLTPRFSEVKKAWERILEAVLTASSQKPLKRLPDHTTSSTSHRRAGVIGMRNSVTAPMRVPRPAVNFGVGRATVQGAKLNLEEQIDVKRK